MNEQNSDSDFIRIDDSELIDDPEGTGINCYFCKHNTNHRVCKAFDWIPDDIWFGKFQHTKPYPNDKGFQFELRNPKLEKLIKWNSK